MQDNVTEGNVSLVVQPYRPSFTSIYWWMIDNDWRAYLQSLLCNEHQQAYADANIDELIDC
jgi:hypothetical protein